MKALAGKLTLTLPTKSLATSWTTGYSDNWYTDRATLLQAITKRNQLDITAPTPIVGDASFALDRVLNIQYMETGDTTFKTLTACNRANNGSGNALSRRDRQLIGFGNDDANILTGTDNKLSSDGKGVFQRPPKRPHPCWWQTDSTIKTALAGRFFYRLSPALQVTGTKNSRLMCAPRSLTRSRNWVR
ncbi:hypothetical protein [Rhodoferax sp.]|uniref:hypothetical protein n=1 Tax=Rhodoferax sp. TaxID=50421 RepID=UPI0025F796DA|nr:hypothetical protein [Rhodoferax sp.]